jgi:hypothetical protein
MAYGKSTYPDCQVFWSNGWVKSVLRWRSMPLPVGRSHAHFAPTIPPPVESVRSRLRGHGETGWPIRSHGQACSLQYDSNRTVHHKSHLGTRTQFVDSKQAVPTAFDPCPPAVSRQSTSAIHAIYHAVPGRCNWWTSLPQNKISREAAHGYR